MTQRTEVDLNKILEPAMNHPVEAGADVSNAFKFYGADIGAWLTFPILILFMLIVVTVFLYFFFRLVKGKPLIG